MSEHRRLQINWVNSAGAALGAVSSAVLLSSLGAAGTLVGAALGSLCITVGGAVYSHYLGMTKERVAAQAVAARPPGRVREPVPAGAAFPSDPPQRAEEADHPDRPVERRSSWQVLHSLPWKPIVGISVGLFGIAMVLIVAFELSTGRALSTFTGGANTDVGTSIPGWSGTGQQSTDVEVDAPQDDVPQEQAPELDGPQEEAPPPKDAPQPAPEQPAP